MTRDQILLAVLVATWPLAGLLEPFAPSYGHQLHNEVSLGHVLVLAVLFFGWCKAHASVHGISPPFGAPLLVALLAPAGLAYYFFRAFGWQSALAGLGKAFLVFMGCGALYAGGPYVGSLLVA
jgi:hypothetical protein